MLNSVEHDKIFIPSEPGSYIFKTVAVNILGVLISRTFMIPDFLPVTFPHAMRRSVSG